MVDQSNDDKKSEQDRLDQIKLDHEKFLRDTVNVKIDSTDETKHMDLDIEPENKKKSKPDIQQIQIEQQEAGRYGRQSGTGAAATSQQQQNKDESEEEKTAKTAAAIAAATTTAEQAARYIEEIEQKQTEIERSIRDLELEAANIQNIADETFSTLDALVDQKNDEIEEKIKEVEEKQSDLKLAQLQTQLAKNKSAINVDLIQKEMEDEKAAKAKKESAEKDLDTTKTEKENAETTRDVASELCAEYEQVNEERLQLAERHKELASELKTLDPQKEEDRARIEEIKQETNKIDLDIKKCSEKMEEIKYEETSLLESQKTKQSEQNSEQNNKNDEKTAETPNDKTDSDKTDIDTPAPKADLEEMKYSGKVENLISANGTINQKDLEEAMQDAPPHVKEKIMESLERKGIEIENQNNIDINSQVTKTDLDQNNDAKIMGGTDKTATVSAFPFLASSTKQSIEETTTPSKTCSGVKYTCFADSEEFHNYDAKGVEASYNAPVNNGTEHAPSDIVIAQREVANDSSDSGKGSSGGGTTLDQEEQLRLAAQQAEFARQQLIEQNEINRPDISDPKMV